jgi:hypothetical protein
MLNDEMDPSAAPAAKKYKTTAAITMSMPRRIRKNVMGVRIVL